MIYTPRVSASQINTFRLCKRRWAYESIERRRSPPSESMLAGTALHSIMEAYLKNGAWPDKPQVHTLWNPARTQSRDVDLVELAKKGLPFLPPAGTAEVEGKFTQEIRGVTYTGFIDLHHRREGVLTVQDHKTSSDPKRYGLAERAEYLDDPQSLIYAMHALGDTEQVVCLEWVYYATRGNPRACATAVLLTRAEVEAAFASVVEPAAREMIQIRKKGLRASDLSRNTDSCMEWFRACDHIQLCKPYEGDTVDMSGLDDFFADDPKPAAAAPARDLMSDLESDPVAAAEAQLAAAKLAKEIAAKAKAAKAAEAQAKRDIINAPEKPAGVGLSAQGIPALGNAKPKDVLLALADLLTKIAGTMTLVFVFLQGCAVDTTPQRIPGSPEIVTGGTGGVAVSEQTLIASMPLPEDFWSTAYRATGRLVYTNPSTLNASDFSKCAIVNGGYCFAPYRLMNAPAGDTEVWQLQPNSNSAWRKVEVRGGWRQLFYGITKISVETTMLVTDNSYYYWFSDIPWGGDSWGIVHSQAGSARFRAVRFSAFSGSRRDGNRRVWLNSSASIPSSDFGSAVIDYEGMIMGYINKYDAALGRVEVQLLASEEMD